MKTLLTVAVTALLAGCVPPPTRVQTPETEAPDRSYTVDLPVGWIRHVAPDKTLLASRDGFPLQTIAITHLSLDKAFPKTKKPASEAMLPSELAELQIAELKNEGGLMTALTVLANAPAEVGGHAGFRLVVAFRTQRGLEMQRVSYGLADKTGYYRIDYVAPKLYYFEKTHSDFDRVVQSFRLGRVEKTASK